jgi:toxoflavin biosynthesis protein ToxD
MTYVSWNDCIAYCQWASKKSGMNLGLPTEAQWEYAAAGSNSKTYPWGNEWDISKAGPDTSILAPAGSKPYYRSHFRILDMAGSLTEWCNDKFKPYDGNIILDFDPLDWQGQVIRGGNYSALLKIANKTADNTISNIFRCTYRDAQNSSQRLASVGFRLSSPGP